MTTDYAQRQKFSIEPITQQTKTTEQSTIVPNWFYETHGYEKLIEQILLMSLTPKQKQELHHAIASYLTVNGFDGAHAEFLKQLSDRGENISQSSEPNILERKWTTVVRLQRRVMELEGQVKKLETDLRVCGATLPTGFAMQQNSEKRQLPRSPHLHQLAGHRSAISRVTFHPV